MGRFLSRIHLRDISLARTEYEVGREIVLRLPKAERNISELEAAAKEGTRGVASGSSRAASSQESVRIWGGGDKTAEDLRRPGFAVICCNEGQ